MNMTMWWAMEPWYVLIWWRFHCIGCITLGLITGFGVPQNLDIFKVNEPVDESFLSKHLDEADLGGDLY